MGPVSEATETLFADAMRSMWDAEDASPRRRTLARLAQHGRQIEAWWKCELTAHLWDHLDRFGSDTYVWMENFDRADLAIATGTSDSGRLLPCEDDGIRIPIELKMATTWWGSSDSAVEKALCSPSKKPLDQDMRDARRRRRATPFAAVGLLVTHVGERTDPGFERYRARARALGEHHELELLIDDEIALPTQDEKQTTARQMFWIARPM